ncbi:hypothetical protein GF376_01800 [Candidatus Peregrinibacteria bacterium]|nr:hypothetical protein [Candidatus Peregrinibacteria bacterium]
MARKTEVQSKLEKLLGERSGQKSRKKVIYGLYDNSAESMYVRINDFLIDHSRVPLKEKAYFFHLLAVMIDAGIPVMQAIDILASKSKNERFVRILDTIAYNLRQGVPLSKAMSRFPDVFGEMELGVIKSGEAAGNLDKMLFKLASELDKSNELQIKLVTASVYPVMVLLILVLAAAGMLTFVIPSLMDLLLEGGLSEEELPLMTKILVGASDFMVAWWWLLVVMGFVIYFSFNFWINTEDGRYAWDVFKLRIPVIGELLRKVYTLRFVSTLGILLESGLPVVKSLEIVAISMNSDTYSLKAWEVINRVKNGEKISDSLADTPFLFSDTISQMIGIGEKTASISLISEKISEHYDTEINHSLKRLTSLFEPLMIIIVGIFVALLALAILMPVFQLSQVVS